MFGVVDRSSEVDLKTKIIERSFVKIHENFDEENPTDNNIALIYAKEIEESEISSRDKVGVISLPNESNDFTGFAGIVSLIRTKF